MSFIMLTLRPSYVNRLMELLPTTIDSNVLVNMAFELELSRHAPCYTDDRVVNMILPVQSIP